MVTHEMHQDVLQDLLDKLVCSMEAPSHSFDSRGGWDGGTQY